MLSLYFVVIGLCFIFSGASQEGNDLVTGVSYDRKKIKIKKCKTNISKQTYKQTKKPTLLSTVVLQLAGWFILLPELKYPLLLRFLFDCFPCLFQMVSVVVLRPPGLSQWSCR